MTRLMGPAGDFAVQVCGEQLFNLAADGMPPLWVPEIETETAALVHVEHVPDPRSSPLVEGTPVPDIVRQAAITDLLAVFGRYREVIEDEGNPLRAARVITNHRQAVEVLAWAQNEAGCPGAVAVHSG